MQKRRDKTHVDTLVVSDTHLGSELSLCDRLIEALAQFSFHRLILNGDIFDHLDFGPSISARLGQRHTVYYSHRLTESHFALLRHIKALADSGVEVVWIEGNHDEGISRLFSALMDLTVHQEFSFEYGGVRYLATHGDQFDEFYRRHRFISDLAWALYVFLQGFPWARGFCRFLKLQTKRLIRALDAVREGALLHAKAKGAHVILCGHTHFAEISHSGDTTYANSGSWTETPSHLLTIGEKGLEIHAF
jgi:UDP-2,3-diacylglucosamine pyrophosphatase LpxH